MFKRLVYAINALPFAGKLALRPLSHRYWNATSKREKVLRFFLLLAILAYFIQAHWTQAQMGFQRLAEYGENPFFNWIFLGYGLVNALVIVAQLHLLWRAILQLPKPLPTHPRKYVAVGCSSLLLYACVTLLGHFIFFAAWLMAISMATSWYR